MVDAIHRVAVLGDGSWGTTLALVLARNGVDTVLWSAFPEACQRMQRERSNSTYLPGIPFPANLTLTADPFQAVQAVDFVVSVVPTQFLREVARRFEEAMPAHLPIVSATKGLEVETLRCPTQILEDVLGKRTLCVLTGPSHAEEVARQLPASLVAGCSDLEFGAKVQTAFNSDSFRVYTHQDAIGAELAGALKNVIAIAAGICDGLELGDNAKSALVTRGVVEIARYGKLRGARPETFFGLAGIGDLATTCFSRHSRNRAVGEALGRGRSLEHILGEMNMVAEGVWTTKALFGPESELEGISMPIAEQVHAVLFEGKDPKHAVLDLMSREPAGEMDGLWGASGA
ncbi:MAG TPA: NAD(P)H-dependent glycerol-3-phosphate dehydrogenase [Planctomycetota bacterium]|nr:NAD(P)H-dependent glycerol-3-phosphate dehydrogenase [Planctomycetota bacterium]HRV82095.1 NAD(P)H-dependent glycerol-3-phosphate dehydrogenase [Planctomycetota bacterium]